MSHTVREYRDYHADTSDTARQKRKDEYAKLVNQYYDLVTDFYEFGWGTSFHFAAREVGESMPDAIKRQEHVLADTLNVGPGQRIVDLGCGVGGPMREIARHTGAEVVGINNNAYQIEKGWKHNRKAELSHLCSFVRCDFMHLPHQDGTFDGAYTIEASCHAADRVAMFREVLRVLKPGAIFSGYEWCLTDAYNHDSAQHREARRDIEEGNGLPDMVHTSAIDAALSEAGFEVVQTRDRALDSPVPWYSALQGHDKNLRALPLRPTGRKAVDVATAFLEKARILPRGTHEVNRFLSAGADALVEGGIQGFFTPMYFFVARKPG